MPTPAPSLFGPELPVPIDRLFAPLCAVLSSEELHELKQQVGAHLREIEEALHRNEFLDVATARRLSTTLIKLLDACETYPESSQQLIAAAARYFVCTKDAENDTTSLLGFDDDVEVLNYVLHQIGNDELRIR